MEVLNVLRQFQIEWDPKTNLLADNNVGLDVLKRQYDILIKNYGDMVILNYSQLGRDSELCRECRGLVLSPYRGWEVVSRGFDRFFNYKPGDNFDFQNSRILEKVDGSYIGLFWFEGAWYFQTRGTLGEGEVSLDCPYKSWHDLCVAALGFESNKMFQNWASANLCEYFAPGTTFIFELVSPWNRVVKWYSQPALYCLGTRIFDEETGETQDWLSPEEQCELFKDLPVKIPASYPFSNYEQIKNAFNTRLFDKFDEGVVCWNPKTNERVKIKREYYLYVHALKGSSGNMTLKKAMDIVKTGETEEVLTYFPEYTDLIMGLENKFNEFIKNAEEAYKELSSIEDQKTFALAAQKTPYSSILFRLRNGKATTAKECLVNANSDKLLEILKCKN